MQPVLTVGPGAAALAAHQERCREIEEAFNEQLALIRASAAKLEEAAEQAAKTRDDLKLVSFQAYQAALTGNLH